jgi:hypothetical protein
MGKEHGTKGNAGVQLKGGMGEKGFAEQGLYTQEHSRRPDALAGSDPSLTEFEGRRRLSRPAG